MVGVVLSVPRVATFFDTSFCVMKILYRTGTKSKDSTAITTVAASSFEADHERALPYQSTFYASQYILGRTPVARLHLHPE